MEKLAVEKSVWINASLERAWQAITQPEHLNKWYATYYHWDIPSLEIGTTVKFYNKDARDTDFQIATIEVVDKPREFTLRWRPEKAYPATSLITSFLLQKENGGVRMTISESGYETLPADERQKWFDATSGGYSLSVENLKAYLEGSVERNIWIKAAREKVWRAVTDPVVIGQWWPPNEWAISKLEVGGRVQFGKEDAAYATITVLDPPRQLTMQWDGNERFPTTTMMTTFILTEENGGTRVNVTESGFESLPEDIRQTRADQTGEGYTSVLEDLKRLLEQ